MACEEHQLLADFIKSVHQNLRCQSRKFGVEVAWKLHCDQHEILDKYATSMKQLATKFWDPNAEDQNKKATSRIEWVIEQSRDYFLRDGMLKERLKEERKLLLYFKRSLDLNVSGMPGIIEVVKNNSSISKMEETRIEQEYTSSDASQLILDLLDVGSCYNPFKSCTFFKVVPIDLVPASADVHQCDFLNASVNSAPNNLQSLVASSIITDMSESSFDIVVFSLLLEYLPSPKQRYHSCLKAYQLLKPEGLLFIITPDSKNPSANAPLMKNWRIALSEIGFVRVYYDKLTHIHCMAYRKSRHTVLAKQLWVSSMKDKCFVCPEDLMKIPQDFQIDESEPIVELVPDRTDQDNQLLSDMFNELPDIY